MVGRMSLTYPKEKLFLYESFSYDALGSRIRVRLQGVNHDQPFHEDILLLYRERVLYEISHCNKTCKKKELRSAFQPIEIPQNATHQAQVIIGSSSGPGQGLLVNNWIGEIPEQKAKYFLTFTEFGCLPITSLYHTDKTGWILSSFFDLVLGIEDPQEFIPPDFCDTAKPVEQGEMVNDFFEALLKKEHQ